MDQRWYAQTLAVINCGAFADGSPLLYPDGRTPATGLTGYEFMPRTFITDTNGITYNDGYAWHNYWNEGYEPWAGCLDIQPGQHVAIYFPERMRSALAAKRNAGKPSFIIEADLSSVGPAGFQNWGSALSDKDLSNGFRAKGSLDTFLSQDQSADYAAVWNLNVDANDDEQKWHQAYRQTTSITCFTVRQWFTRWWLNTNGPITACGGSALFLPINVNQIPVQ